jgi:catechol 1,2-dioxygenase
VTATLIGKLERQSGPHPADGDIGDWFTLDHTLVLEPGISTLPVPPIK